MPDKFGNPTRAEIKAMQAKTTASVQASHAARVAEAAPAKERARADLRRLEAKRAAEKLRREKIQNRKDAERMSLDRRRTAARAAQSGRRDPAPAPAPAPVVAEATTSAMAQPQFTNPGFGGGLPGAKPTPDPILPGTPEYDAWKKRMEEADKAFIEPEPEPEPDSPYPKEDITNRAGEVLVKWGDYVPGEIIISPNYRDHTGDGPSLGELNRRFGATNVPGIRIPEIIHIRLAPGTSMNEALQAYQSHPGVQHAMVNRKMLKAPPDGSWAELPPGGPVELDPGQFELPERRDFSTNIGSMLWQDIQSWKTPPDSVLQVTLTLREGSSVDASAIEAIGGQIRSQGRSGRLTSILIPAGRIAELAALYEGSGFVDYPNRPVPGAQEQEQAQAPDAGVAEPVVPAGKTAGGDSERLHSWMQENPEEAPLSFDETMLKMLREMHKQNQKEKEEKAREERRKQMEQDMRHSMGAYLEANPSGYADLPSRPVEGMDAYGYDTPPPRGVEQGPHYLEYGVPATTGISVGLGRVELEEAWRHWENLGHIERGQNWGTTRHPDGDFGYWYQTIWLRDKDWRDPGQQGTPAAYWTRPRP